MVKLQKLATQPPCHKVLFERVTNHLRPTRGALSARDRDERANVGSAESSPVSPDPSWWVSHAHPLPSLWTV